MYGFSESQRKRSANAIVMVFQRPRQRIEAMSSRCEPCSSPLRCIELQPRVRHQAMPNNRLERFRMRRDPRRLDGWNDDDNVALLLGIAAIAADDAEHAKPSFLDSVTAATMLGLTFFSMLPPPTEKTKIASSRVGSADLQPLRKDRMPAFVVRPSGQLRHIVRGCVGLDPAQLAKIVDGVAAVARAAANANDEEPAATIAQRDQFRAQRFDGVVGQPPRRLTYFFEIGGGMGHGLHGPG